MEVRRKMLPRVVGNPRHFRGIHVEGRPSGERKARSTVPSGLSLTGLHGNNKHEGPVHLREGGNEGRFRKDGLTEDA